MILADDEILKAQKDYAAREFSRNRTGLSVPLGGWRRDKCLLEAQARHIYEWGEEKCDEHGWLSYISRRACPECWEELREELYGKEMS